MKFLHHIAFACAFPALLAAQSSPPFRRVQVGLEATQVRLHSSFGSTPWGGAARIAVRPSLRHPGALLEGTLFYTGEADNNQATAGLAGGQVGLLLLIPPPKHPEWPSFEVSFGYAALHYDADKYKSIADGCIPYPGCMLGAEHAYESVWRSAVHAGLSLEMPVRGRWAMRGGGAVLLPIGNVDGVNGSKHLRFSIGGAWWL